MNLMIMFTTTHVDIHGSNMMAIQTFYMMVIFTIYMMDILTNTSYLSRNRTLRAALLITPAVVMMPAMCTALTAGTKLCRTLTTPTT